LKKTCPPPLGNRPVSLIKAPELLAVLRKIEGRGSIDIAHRAKQCSGLIFRYAVAYGRAETDPSRDLTGALIPKRRTKHHASITDPKQIGELLISIDSYQGTIVVNASLKISILLFQRPGEIRNMEWSEINWKESRWELPGAKMKMGLDHIVPLSKQAVSVLEQLHMHTGRGRYVFPSARGASGP
jgi:integrase